jgi:hypothetical protein
LINKRIRPKILVQLLTRRYCSSFPPSISPVLHQQPLHSTDRTTSLHPTCIALTLASL